MLYNCMMEASIALDLAREAEEFGTKSLEVTNSVLNRDSPIVEWTLHLLTKVMIKEQKFFYAEGLLRRLDAIILEKEQVEEPLFQIQLDTLQLFYDLMIQFNRSTEANILRERIDHLNMRGRRNNLLFHARFGHPHFNYVLDSGSGGQDPKE
eukprot:TRINITY_DN20037_c0_g1_i2.p2 TRINITY_DN20037_c0_g1~~TRINITY_DN20037_c0_g1_i2.p2  ORF type:complete len:152 (-),score=36.71 TRINITY_DN20037_c0_g1_i2:390-845(-)